MDDNLVQRLVRSAYDAGYYAATLEKCELADDVREGYELLRDQAISERKSLQQQLDKRI